MAEVLDWFAFNGRRCADFGIHVEELPPILIAEERVKFEEVPGRSGDLAIMELNAAERPVYKAIEPTIECIVDDVDQLDSMAAWLQGAGVLVLPNRPGGYYTGRVIGEMSLERIIKARENRRFSVDFHLDPYFYLNDAGEIEITNASHVLQNPGTAESAPRITVYGSGDVGLAIAGQSILLTGLTDGIILDTVLQDALSLDGAQLMNNHMAGDFPTLPPGSSTVAWSAFDGNDNAGTVTRIVIAPRWRCR